MRRGSAALLTELQPDSGPKFSGYTFKERGQRLRQTVMEWQLENRQSGVKESSWPPRASHAFSD